MLAASLPNSQLSKILQLNESFGLNSSTTVSLPEQHGWDPAVAANHILNLAETPSPAAKHAPAEQVLISGFPTPTTEQ
jgi:hypothetical protein